jgi:hypothetical protein
LGELCIDNTDRQGLQREKARGILLRVGEQPSRRQEDYRGRNWTLYCCSSPFRRNCRQHHQHIPIRHSDVLKRPLVVVLVALHQVYCELSYRRTTRCSHKSRDTATIRLLPWLLLLFDAPHSRQSPSRHTKAHDLGRP